MDCTGLIISLVPLSSVGLTRNELWWDAPPLKTVNTSVQRPSQTPAPQVEAEAARQLQEWCVPRPDLIR